MRTCALALLILLAGCSAGCSARIDTWYPEDGKGPHQKVFLLHDWRLS